MVGGGGDQEASAVEVGTVEEDLVVDAVGLWGGRWLDPPAPGESSGQCVAVAAVFAGQFGQGLLAGDPGDEQGEGRSVFVGGLGSSGEAVSAVGASPPGGPFGGGAVFLGEVAACGAAWSVGRHP